MQLAWWRLHCLSLLYCVPFLGSLCTIGPFACLIICKGCSSRWFRYLMGQEGIGFSSFAPLKMPPRDYRLHLAS